jgi:HAD superfamily hydrolase (TIGR01509 family)
MVRGVLLDVDGTIVLSNDAHAQAWVEAFAEYNYTVAFEKVRPLIGMGGDQLLPTLVPELNTGEGLGKQISDKRKEIFLSKYAPTLQPAPGARALIEKMLQSGLRIVIASSANREELDVLLKAAEVSDLSIEATTASDVEKSKPAPDVVATALEKIQMQPGETLMLGDTPYDIRAAQKCQVPVIAFRCGGFPEEELRGAVAIYNDPQDLLNHYHESPLNTKPAEEGES